MKEKECRIDILSAIGSKGLEIFHVIIKKNVGLNRLKIEKYSLFNISIWALFFVVEDSEKTKCGITFGGSCQIRNQLDQSFVGSCPLIS